MKQEFPNIRLRDVVNALEKRGRKEEAEYWHLVVAIELGMRQGISENDVLDMEMNKILFLMQLPERPAGWDNWYWGKSALGSNKG